MSIQNEEEKLLVQAHIADYQVITARISRFMGIQFVPWPALFAFLVLLATAHTLFDAHRVDWGPAFLAWGAAGAIQIAVLVYYFALFEVYNHVRYVETILKPRLIRLVGTDEVWSYEGFLKRTGKANSPLLGDIGPAVPAISSVVVAGIFRIPGSGWDYIGSALNTALLLIVIASAIRVVNSRRAFTSVA